MDGTFAPLPTILGSDGVGKSRGISTLVDRHGFPGMTPDDGVNHAAGGRLVLAPDPDYRSQLPELRAP